MAGPAPTMSTSVSSIGRSGALSLGAVSSTAIRLRGGAAKALRVVDAVFGRHPHPREPLRIHAVSQPRAE
jgi:hypothetical protein